MDPGPPDDDDHGETWTPVVTHGSKPLSRIDPDRLYERLRTLGKIHSKAKAAYNLLARGEKAYLAKLAVAAMREHSTSVTHADKLALASDEYAEYLQAMADAEQARDDALVDYETAKTWVELARSANANERERLKVLGMLG